MKHLLFFLSLCLLASCSHRLIPPEIAALHEQTSHHKYIRPKKEVVIVDAGHGGKDAGTNSKQFDYEEKQLTLDTAFLVCEYLNELGYKTVLTRDRDVFVPLDERAEIANAAGADLFVSVHYNHSSSHDVEGIEVYYYKEGKTPPSPRIVSSKEFGHEVLKKIVRHTGAESRGVKQANFAVVRQTTMPAILIEAGFLSNPVERKKIQNLHYRRSLAQGIAHGVDQYLESQRR